MKKIVAVSFVVLGIQACSSGSPSTSDVTRALEPTIQGCQNLSIENVKIVNGVEVDALTHQVQAQYDVKVTPLPEERVKEAQKLQEQWDAEKQSLIDHFNELKEQQKDLGAKMAPLQAQVDQDLQAAGVSQSNTTPTEYDARRKALSDKYGLTPLEEQSHDLWAQLEPGTYNMQPTTKTIDVLGEWGGHRCIDRSGSGQDWFNAVTKGAVNTLNISFVMRKTDNGWMAAN